METSEGQRPYQEVQKGEANPMAKQGRQRCSGLLEIPRRSACCRQRDPVEDERDVLEGKQGRNNVRELREIILGEMVQRGIEGRPELTVIVVGSRWNLRARELACEQPGGSRV
jgi:hypothetical protein